jgi:hypothetical protein
MKIDIIAIDPLKSINNKYAVTSVFPTGKYSKLLVRANYPGNLTIANIESKFGDRFDNPSYYHGGNWEKFGGNIDGCDIDDENGDVLGV